MKTLLPAAVLTALMLATVPAQAFSVTMTVLLPDTDFPATTVSPSTKGDATAPVPAGN